MLRGSVQTCPHPPQRRKSSAAAALRSDRQSVLWAPHCGQGTLTGVGWTSMPLKVFFGRFQTCPHAAQRK